MDRAPGREAEALGRDVKMTMEETRKSEMAVLPGPAEVAPPYTDIPGILASRSREDRTWLHFHQGKKEARLSGREAAVYASRWAAAWRGAGAKPGDRVLIMLPNGLEFVGAFLGASLAELTAVPVAAPIFASDVERRVAAIRPLIDAARPSAAATTSLVKEKAGWGLPTIVEPEPVATAAATSSAYPAFIQFTSGTTNAPKGAVISQRAAVTSAFLMGHALGLGASDVGVSWLPLYHDMGLVGSLLCSLVFDFPLHLMTQGEFLLHPERWMERSSESRATITVGPNFAYELSAKRTGSKTKLDLGSLRFALNGSEPVHRTTIDDFEGRFGSDGLRRGTILPVYGLAENSLGVSFGSPGSSTPDLVLGPRRVPSVGRPLAGIEVRIEAEDGSIASSGCEGEICVRSPTLFDGYFENPEATAAALSDGWLRTGDLGVIDKGQLFVTGRKKDLVIKAGQKFHPYELERVVAECVDGTPNGVAVFSRGNAGKGTEDLFVIVELRRSGTVEDVAGLERTVRGRLMEAVGVRADVVRFVGPGVLPRTTSGKLRRGACAELFAENA